MNLKWAEQTSRVGRIKKKSGGVTKSWAGEGERNVFDIDPRVTPQASQGTELLVSKLEAAAVPLGEAPLQDGDQSGKERETLHSEEVYREYPEKRGPSLPLEGVQSTSKGGTAPKRAAAKAAGRESAESRESPEEEVQRPRRRASE